ncbi:MAG: FadR/GntR family transcriptional regulator [Lautropia sp.]
MSDPLKPVRPPKAAVAVADKLRHQIVAGRLKPGDKLQPESALQVEFGVSRPTLREALRLLEAESLISISRGKHGGARVRQVDLGAAARQVGIYLQIERTSLQDVWLARTVIEPPAAALLARVQSATAFEALEANIAAARDAARNDLIRYADLSAEFSMLITRHCGSKTLHLLASLIYDIIRRQHEDVTERTIEKSSVDQLRQRSIGNREEAVRLMRTGRSEEVERFWRHHLERMRDLVLAAYDGPKTIDILNEPARELRRPLSNFRRTSAPARPKRLRSEAQ